MPTIKLRRAERFKVAEYSWAEFEAEVTTEHENIKVGLVENHKVLRSYMRMAREGIKKALERGEFDLTD